MIVRETVHKLPLFSGVFFGNCTYFDIETTGLSPQRSHLCTLGIADRENDTLRLRQWVPEKPAEEADVLQAAAPFLQKAGTLVHFNGSSFDLPYLQKRCALYDLPDPFEGVKQLDLYRELRPFRGIFAAEHMRQKDLEAWLGIPRKDQLSGKDVISRYRRYLETGETACIEQVLLHNAEDVLHLARLQQLLVYPALCRGEFALERWEVQTVVPAPVSVSGAAADESQNYAHSFQESHTEGSPSDSAEKVSGPGTSSATEMPSLPLAAEDICSFDPDSAVDVSAPLSHTGHRILTFHLYMDIPLPKPLQLTEWPYSLEGEGHTIRLQIQGRSGELRHFFSPWKDYYYFPEEDQAYHKSVAMFADPAHRKKATAATCYQRRQGLFFPQPTALLTPVFYETDSKGTPWFPAAAVDTAGTDLLQKYVCEILCRILRTR